MGFAGYFREGWHHDHVRLHPGDRVLRFPPTGGGPVAVALRR